MWDFFKKPPSMKPDLSTPTRRNSFRKQLEKYYSDIVTDENVFWIAKGKNWILVCPWANDVILRKYNFIVKNRPANNEALIKKKKPDPSHKNSAKTQDKSKRLIACVNAQRILTCPNCLKKFKNVQDPFPRKAKCPKCHQPLMLILEK